MPSCCLCHFWYPDSWPGILPELIFIFQNVTSQLFTAYLCRSPLSLGTRRHKPGTSQGRLQCIQSTLCHRLWRTNTNDNRRKMLFKAADNFRSKCCISLFTLAGIRAFRVKAELIFFTWRRIFGALIYICNTDTSLIKAHSCGTVIIYALIWLLK